MMSRAYWTGLIPRSLSRVRSQASRPIPATRIATLSISWSISAAVTSSFCARSPCSISLRATRVSRISSPLRATHSSASCWRVIDLAVDGGDRVGRVDRDRRQLAARTCPAGTRPTAACAGRRGRGRPAPRRPASPLPAAGLAPAAPGRRRSRPPRSPPGRTPSRESCDRDPLRSSRGISFRQARPGRRTPIGRIREISVSFKFRSDAAETLGPRPGLVNLNSPVPATRPRIARTSGHLDRSASTIRTRSPVTMGIAASRRTVRGDVGLRMRTGADDAAIEADGSAV